MVKFQIRITGAFAILLMLGASPLSVTYSFAENESIQVENREFRAILTEKVVDGKLQINQYSLPEKFSEDDMKRMLSSNGQISWAYVNYKMYQSGIILFDGKVSKIGENLWEISIEDDFSKDLRYNIVFSGKIAEMDKENVFAISFMNYIAKNPEMTQIVKLLQIEESVINSEKSIGSNQEFRNSISVR